MKLKALFFVLFISKFVAAQNGKDFLYVFDKDWKPVDIKQAVYLIHVLQVSDSCWQGDYYNLYGPLIKTEHYKEKDGSTLNGEAYYYNEKGNLDSGGTYENGKKNGDFWKIANTKMQWKFKYLYRNDTLIETIDVAKKDKEEAIADSIRKSKGIKDRDEKESEYPGGNAGWARYLNKNLKYPDRAVNGNFQGIVSISFVVDTAGNVINPYISQSVEYSLDMEALEIITKSGKWIPAVQDGRKVKSYKLQPIQFKLQ